MKKIVEQMRNAKGKEIHIICHDGTQFYGLCSAFEEGYDNENGQADIIVRLTNGKYIGLYETDIKNLVFGD